MCVCILSQIFFLANLPLLLLTKPDASNLVHGDSPKDIQIPFLSPSPDVLEKLTD